jgi:hypothetical protein
MRVAGWALSPVFLFQRAHALTLAHLPACRLCVAVSLSLLSLSLSPFPTVPIGTTHQHGIVLLFLFLIKNI